MLRLLVAGMALLMLLSGCQPDSSSPSNGVNPPACEEDPSAGEESPPAGQPPADEGSSNDLVQEPPGSATPSPAPEPADPVKDMIDQMSLRDKIGQMVMVGIEGTEFNGEMRALLEEGRVGGVILFRDNIESVDQTVKLVNSLKQANREAGIPAPLLLATDQEGGRVSRLPQEIAPFPAAMSIGSTQDPDAAFQAGAAAGLAMQALGLNTDLAPVLDIHTNPDNPVIGDRSFGTNAEAVSSMGVSFMKGLKSQGVISVVKHFPGHGDTSTDSHTGLPVVSHTMQRLREVELVPFAAAIEQGADAVMVAHLLMTELDPALPATMSERVTRHVLRDELGFDGVVITDDMTMGAIEETMEIGPASVQAVLAGADIVLVAHDPDKQKAAIDALLDAAASGEIAESAIDRSVERILRLKQDSELSDEPVGVPNLGMLNRNIEEALEPLKR